MFTPIAIVHGIIGLISLGIVLGTFKIKTRNYFLLALAGTLLVVVSGVAIKLSGESHWWRIGLETLGTALVYGLILYRNRQNINNYK